MELQNFLREEGLEKLVEKYKIKINRHLKYPHLVCLKYSQIESPMEEKVVQQSRGIILNEKDNWSVVSYSYDKFFNYGESCASKIDWDSARIYDKLDGSLMILYYYDNQWQVQTSGTADATGEVNGFNFNFSQLFWRVFNELNYPLPEEKNLCFIFELLTPYNRVVVQQLENNLVLHGVRNRDTLGEETPDRLAGKYGFNLVKTFSLNSWQDVIDSAEKLEPTEGEGYVICDRYFNRVKVKSSRYVALAHFRSSFSTRKMLSIIVNNEGDEFLNYYPEWTNYYQEIQKKYEDLVTQIDRDYQKYQDIEIQKDFAFAIKHLPYNGILFALRSGKSQSIKEGLAKTSIFKLEILLDVKNIDLSI